MKKGDKINIDGCAKANSDYGLSLNVHNSSEFKVISRKTDRVSEQNYEQDYTEDYVRS